MSQWNARRIQDLVNNWIFLVNMRRACIVAMNATSTENYNYTPYILELSCATCCYRIGAGIFLNEDQSDVHDFQSHFSILRA